MGREFLSGDVGFAKTLHYRPEQKQNETVGDLLKRTGMTLDQLFTEFFKRSHGIIGTEEAHSLKGKEGKNVRRAKMHKSPAGL